MTAVAQPRTDLEPVLDVQHLTVRYSPKLHPALDAVRDVSFSIAPGEFVGLIGESGSGKSTLGNAILQLTERPGKVTGGKVLFKGQDLTQLNAKKLQPIRWRDVSTVFQSSMNSLNPVTRVAAQFRDAIELHSPLRGNQVDERVRELFDLVMIDHKFITAYPHELSGGMRQRVNLALALANQPELVVLDEPTTGLDMIVQRNILDNVRSLQKDQGFAVLFISHDIGTVLNMSDRILVMYAGRIVETHDSSSIIEHPLHPYTKGLLGSYGNPQAETVEISYVPGRPPDLTQPHTGCLFAPRCPEAMDICRESDPKLEPIGDAEAACFVAQLQHSAPDTPGLPTPTRYFDGPKFVKTIDETTAALQQPVLLTVDHVDKVYRTRRGLSMVSTPAVTDVSFELRRGMVTALVGQSGSGKSTLGRLITGVEKPTKGDVVFTKNGEQVHVPQLGSRALRNYRRDVQMVFQDPYSALNPNKSLAYLLNRPLKNFRSMSGTERRAEIDRLLERVALTPVSKYRNRYPHELSGGQRQRVVIARALAADPELIVADEPISSLDVSIRAEVLELLNDLVHESDVGVLYITHDLLSARMLADEVIVLHQGSIVEQGTSVDVIREPQHDYTKRLLEAIPHPFAQR